MNSWELVGQCNQIFEGTLDKLIKFVYRCHLRHFLLVGALNLKEHISHFVIKGAFEIRNFNGILNNLFFLHWGLLKFGRFFNLGGLSLLFDFLGLHLIERDLLGLWLDSLLFSFFLILLFKKFGFITTNTHGLAIFLHKRNETVHTAFGKHSPTFKKFVSYSFKISIISGVDWGFLEVI
jgi:hypothetical protein